MKEYFDMNTTYEDIMLAMLEKSHEETFTARFFNGEEITFDRHKVSDNIITEIIESKIKAFREAYNERFAAV